MTMPQISILIPFFGCEKELEATLVSVLENRPEASQIIVPHRGNYSDPYDLGEEVQFVEFAESGFQLGEILRQLLPQIDSPLIHLLRSGVQVSHGWTDEIEEAFEDPYVGAVCPVVLAQDKMVQDKKTICVGVENTFFYGNCFLGKRKTVTRPGYDEYQPVGPTQIAGFYRRESLEQITCLGDFSDSLFGLEIGLALEAIGFECKVVGSSVVHGSEEFFEEVSGAESQKAIWRYSGSIGFFQGFALSLLATSCDLVASLVSAKSRKSLQQRLVHFVDSKSAQSFREFVEQADGPTPEGATFSVAAGELNLSGIESDQARRAA